MCTDMQLQWLVHTQAKRERTVAVESDDDADTLDTTETTIEVPSQEENCRAETLLQMPDSHDAGTERKNDNVECVDSNAYHIDSSVSGRAQQCIRKSPAAGKC